MELRHSSCKCNTDGNYVQSCCFNPVIFFVCKLCRGAFKNVEKLLLHKRQHHSLKDLIGIKFIIFEERFVETDDNMFLNELNSTAAPLRCVSANNLSNINLVPPVHQENSLVDLENDIIDIPDESKEFKLPNPFVHLKRLTSKEINCYLRPTAATNQNQEGKCVDVNDQDERCDSTAKQNVSWDKITTNINAISINNCSDSTSNKNVSANLKKNDPAPETIVDGKFIVANIIQSSDGIGRVQFVSVCAPVNPEKEPNSKKRADDKQQQQLNINKALCSDVNLFKTEEDHNFKNSDSFALIAEEVSNDAGGSPSPMPLPFEVVLSLTEAQIKTEDQSAGAFFNNSEVSELIVEVSTSQIYAFPQTAAETLAQLSLSSMAGDRSVRNRSNIKYLENQTCAKCSRDFYTVEELETHEKLCLRNQTNRKREKLRKRDSELLTISDGAQAAHDAINDNDEIRVKQTAEIFPNPNDLEVTVRDSKSDQDCDFPDVISSSRDSGIGTGGAELNLGKKKVITDFRLRSPNTNLRRNKVADKKSGMKGKNNSCVIRHKVNNTETPEDYTECSLSLKDWIRKEKEAHPENIILLDPDPFQAEAITNEVETPVFVVTSQNPTKCKLCSMQLTSDLDAKRHVKFCWTKNKTKHVHCPLCSKSYVGNKGLWKHKKIKHSKQPKKTLSLICTICSKVMTTKEGFKTHMEIHRNPNLKPFVCEVCGSGFRFIFSLHRHKLSHSEDRPFKCKLCPKAFKTKEFLGRHRGVHIKDSNYHCLPCNKSFKSKDLLQSHSRYHLKDKWYSCKAEHCDSKFATRLSVWNHCKKYHAELFSQLAKLSCIVCNEKFMYNCQLENHMSSHGGEKRFKCSEEGCNRAFISKSNLRRHSGMYTRERSYQCDTCGTTFARQCLFLIHLKEHKSPKVRVLCHLCPKTFPRNWELQQHLTFHEKGRQFSCEKCDSKFMSKANLKGHMKTHERKDASDDVSSSSRSSESEVESEGEEGTTEESEPESEQDIKRRS